MQAVRFGKIRLEGLANPNADLSQLNDSQRNAFQLIQSALEDSRVGAVKDMISDTVTLDITAKKNDTYQFKLKSGATNCIKYDSDANTTTFIASMGDLTYTSEHLKQASHLIVDRHLSEALNLTVAQKLAQLKQETSQFESFVERIPRLLRPHTNLRLAFDTENSKVTMQELYKILHPEYTPKKVQVLKPNDTVMIGEPPETVLSWLNIEQPCAEVNQLTKAEKARLDYFRQAMDLTPLDLVKQLGKMLISPPDDFSTSLLDSQWRESVRATEQYRIFEKVLAKKLSTPLASAGETAEDISRAVENSHYKPSAEAQEALRNKQFIESCKPKVIDGPPVVIAPSPVLTSSPTMPFRSRLGHAITMVIKGIGLGH